MKEFKLPDGRRLTFSEMIEWISQELENLNKDYERMYKALEKCNFNDSPTLKS